MESFLRLSDGTSQYLPRAASYFSDMASKFADWVDKTRATGEIVASMKQVVEQAGYLKDSFKACGASPRACIPRWRKARTGSRGSARL